MTLVDTSVWIDFLAGQELLHVEALEQLIIDNEDLALCGIVLTEVLQGIADDSVQRRVRQYLSPLIMLPMDETVFYNAADIYRTLRKHGITIRKTNDCIISATVLQHQCKLLHNDKDFIPIEEHFNLLTVHT